jgi:hypothetical protein
MPSAAIRSAPPACATIACAQARLLAQISSGSCSTRAGAGVALREFAVARQPRQRAVRVNSIARVLVVPSSITRIARLIA